MRLKESFAPESEIFGFQEEPVEEEKYHKDASGKEEKWGGSLDGGCDFWIIGECGGEYLNHTNSRIRHPDDDEREEASHDKHREEESPKEKPSLRFFAHTSEDFGVNDGIIDTGDNFKEG